MRAIGIRIALCLAASFAGIAADAGAASSPVIQYAEPVTVAQKSGSAQFDAYGRRFSLSLVDNERVLNKLMEPYGGFERRGNEFVKVFSRPRRAARQVAIDWQPSGCLTAE